MLAMSRVLLSTIPSKCLGIRIFFDDLVVERLLAVRTADIAGRCAVHFDAYRLGEAV